MQIPTTSDRATALIKARALFKACLKASLAAALVATALASTASKASADIGFSGSLSTQYWEFAVNGTPLIDPPPPGCETFPAVSSCLDINEASVGNVYMGLTYQEPTNPTLATWTWINTTGSTYYISFSYLVDAPENTAVTASYSVGTTTEGQSGSLSAGSFADSNPNMVVAPDQQIVFTLSVPSTQSSGGFQISGFSYAVPGPLPAAGAASAFGFSRRLRRRVKGQPTTGSRPARIPAHPTAYLQLSPAALHSLPLSFSYSQVPAASFGLEASPLPDCTLTSQARTNQTPTSCILAPSTPAATTPGSTTAANPTKLERTQA